MPSQQNVHQPRDPHHDLSMRTVQFDDLWAAWPRTGERESLTKTLQGDLAAFDHQNFEDSVVRLSTAFNKAGHSVMKSSNFTGETYRD
jgi:hypothetical protein